MTPVGALGPHKQKRGVSLLPSEPQSGGLGRGVAQLEVLLGQSRAVETGLAKEGRRSR